MKSKRQLQVAEMIKRNFSLVLQSEGSYIYGVEPLVTVTGVKISPDFGLASVYLSIYNTDNKQAVLLMMEEENAALRHSLSQRLKRQIRRVPELRFFEDDTLDEMIRVNQLFNKIDQENKENK